MHEKFLLAALEQARLGRGLCAPNPSVGAVAVQNGKIIAQAWHQGAGTAHAEQLLLAQFSPKTPEVSLYITLEPCNHWGKTPPCVDAIIAHGIKQVFFAYIDPNPIVACNNSSELLRAQGIQVTHLPLPEINDFYQSYAYWIRTRKPRVTVKIAQTLDGKIGRYEGERLILSNSLCHEFTHKMRAETDVILTTARTIHHDNPKMNARLPHKTQAKPVAIIDRTLSLSSDAAIYSNAKACHIYYDKQIIKQNQDVPGTIHYHPMTLTADGMDLNAIIGHLGESGYHDVWVEAGGALFSALHREGLVDRTYIYLIPSSLKSDDVSAYQQEEMFNRPHTVSWHPQGDNMIVCLDWLED